MKDILDRESQENENWLYAMMIGKGNFNTDPQVSSLRNRGKGGTMNKDQKEIGVPQSQKEGSWREKGWWLGNDSTQRVLNSDGNWTHEACAQTDKGKCTSDLQPVVMKLEVDANDTDEGGELDHLEGEDGLESTSQQSEPNE